MRMLAMMAVWTGCALLLGGCKTATVTTGVPAGPSRARPEAPAAERTHWRALPPSNAGSRSPASQAERPGSPVREHHHLAKRGAQPGWNTAKPAQTGSVDQAEEAWFSNLRPGQLDWDVPPTMTLNEPRMITVRLHGYEDVGKGADALPGASGTASLKVATRMKAELVAAVGDDLKVTPQSEQGVQYVPATGFQDWSWMVTPVHSARSETLRLTVEAILDADHSRSFVTYSRPFAIGVASAGSVKDYTEENFGSLAKYWGPGGAGFLAVAGAVTWWRKRRAGASAAAGTHGGD